MAAETSPLQLKSPMQRFAPSTITLSLAQAIRYLRRAPLQRQPQSIQRAWRLERSSRSGRMASSPRLPLLARSLASRLTLGDNRNLSGSDNCRHASYESDECFLGRGLLYPDQYNGLTWDCGRVGGLPICFEQFESPPRWAKPS